MSAPSLRIAMVGTRGVPARYGGFETAVEEIGSRLVERGHRVRVYCRAGSDEKRVSYRGMELVTLPAVRRRELETLSHTALSSFHLVFHRTDVALVFNAANAPLLPLIRIAGIPVATHVDGLEWRRAKWGTWGRRYYRWAERAAVRQSDALIADSYGIRDYYEEEFGARSRYIAYGAPILDDVSSSRLHELDLAPAGYHLVVARFEKENHVLEIVEGFRRSASSRPLVVVGSAPYANDYQAAIRGAAAGDDRIRILGPVWDQPLLDQLYRNAFAYLHGHSVGGTNPSLLRAIGASAPTIAIDVPFNREVLGDSGAYFAAGRDLAELLERAELDPAATRARGERGRRRAESYTWDAVAADYETLARDLHQGRTPGPVRGAARQHARAVAVPTQAGAADG